jgi:hypothetical protein
MGNHFVCFCLKTTTTKNKQTKKTNKHTKKTLLLELKRSQCSPKYTVSYQDFIIIPSYHIRILHYQWQVLHFYANITGTKLKRTQVELLVFCTLEISMYICPSLYHLLWTCLLIIIFPGKKSYLPSKWEVPYNMALISMLNTLATSIREYLNITVPDMVTLGSPHL